MPLLPTSRRDWLRSFLRPLLIICTIVLLVYACCLVTLVAWGSSRTYWIRKTVRTLESYPPPIASKKALGDGKWIFGTANRQSLIFSNGWAYFAANTIDMSPRIGAVAILRSSDGAIYISDNNYDVGLDEYSHKPQPKDLQDFLRKFGGGWEKQ